MAYRPYLVSRDPKVLFTDFETCTWQATEPNTKLKNNSYPNWAAAAKEPDGGINNVEMGKFLGAWDGLSSNEQTEPDDANGSQDNGLLLSLCRAFGRLRM